MELIKNFNTLCSLRLKSAYVIARSQMAVIECLKPVINKKKPCNQDGVTKNRVRHGGYQPERFLLPLIRLWRNEACNTRSRAKFPFVRCWLFIICPSRLAGNFYCHN